MSSLLLFLSSLCCLPSIDMSNVDAGSVKLPRLEKPEDFIQWKRRMKAYIRRDDPLLLGLSQKPENFSPTSHANWLKKSVKAKSNITLSLGDAPMSRTRVIVDDDDATAKGSLGGA